tara:strand:- start:2017 stop:2958 length:942 start_codon:yes stop_codon:yes gene_type:complete
MKNILVWLCFALVFSTLLAQKQKETLIQVQWDNDLYLNLDKYYTNGFHLLLINPELKKIVINKILFPKKKETNVFHGLSVSQEIYTPDKYMSKISLPNDRPYACALYATLFNINLHPSSHYSYTSSFSLGLIGPYALGKNVQLGWHEFIEAHRPRGWNTQIKTDIIINYNIELQKGVINHNNMSLTVFNNLQLGTYKTKIEFGSKITLGIFNDKFSSLIITKNSNKNWLANIEFEARTSFIGYDATMQGGLLTSENIVAFDSNYIKTMVHSGCASLNFGYKTFLITSSITSLTPEFKDGKPHGYGSIKLTVAL